MTVTVLETVTVSTVAAGGRGRCGGTPSPSPIPPVGAVSHCDGASPTVTVAAAAAGRAAPGRALRRRACGP